MSDKFQPINRYTTYLLPPSLQDWLPEKHLARFVVDIVDQLDLSRLVNHYGGGGKAPYHPALLLGLLFYVYATGVFSSRKLEQATHDSVAFRFITGDTHPDHDTIATFRKRFLPELEGLFVQMLVVAKEMGLFKLGKVSLDGTKIKANASKHKALSWGYAKQLEEQLRREVQTLLRWAEQVDAEEEPEFDIPDELARREDRLAAIKKAQSLLWPLRVIDLAVRTYIARRGEWRTPGQWGDAVGLGIGVVVKDLEVAKVGHPDLRTGQLSLEFVNVVRRGLPGWELDFKAGRETELVCRLYFEIVVIERRNGELGCI